MAKSFSYGPVGGGRHTMDAKTVGMGKAQTNPNGGRALMGPNVWERLNQASPSLNRSSQSSTRGSGVPMTGGTGPGPGGNPGGSSGGSGPGANTGAGSPNGGRFSI